MSTLRIVTVLPSIDWRFGGSVGQAQLIAGALARRGHAVSILTTDQGQSDGEVNAWREVDGYRVFVARAGFMHRRPPYPAPRRLLAELEVLLPATDVVTTQVGLTLLNVATARRCARHGVPFVYSAQGALDPDRLAQKRLRKLVFLAMCERPLLRRAALLQALTEAEAEDLRRQGAPATRVAVVPNGVDPDAFRSGDRARVRSGWGVPESTVVLLFLGRLAPEKGLVTAIEAAAPILRERAGVHLVVAGPDGGSADDARGAATRLGVAERVTFHGPVAPADRCDVLAAADVFVHPSASEGLPLAVLEAAAAGLPVWISDRCNIPEVREFAAGAIAAFEPAELTRALRPLVDDADLRQRAGTNARRMVAERFALSRVVDRLEELYAAVTARAHE